MPKRVVSSLPSSSSVSKSKASKESSQVTAHEHGNRKRKGKPETQEAAPSRSSSDKGKRKKAKQEMPPVEQRLGRYIPSPNAAVRERIARAFTHRLYLIEKKAIGNVDAPSACEFYVLGATGNVYTVKLETLPSCTCPDFTRGNTCKHILFVMLRVLKLPSTDPRVWQKALLSSELNDLLHLSSINEAVVASQLVRQRFKEIISGLKGQEAAGVKAGQRELEGDCPICYERMANDEGKALEPVVFCKSCGNNVHKDCFRRWSQSKGSGKVTCIYCRALWRDNTKGKKLEGDEMGRGGYVNLASYSEAHQNEDTSLEALYPESSMWIERRARR